MIHTFLFSSKLRGLLLQYLDERKVTKFDELVSLLVSDRIKSSLTDQCLKYVLSIESNLPIDTQQWFDGVESGGVKSHKFDQQI